MRRVGIRWRTVALTLITLIVGGILSIIVFPAASTPTSPITLHYTNIPTTSPSRGAAIAAMEQLTNPSDILSAQNLPITLGTSNLPSQDPVVRYMQTLSNASSTMQQTETDLRLAQGLASSGDVKGASTVVNRLVALRNETGTLINTLYNLLDLIKSEPNVNQAQVQLIRQRLDEFRRSYIEYSVEIDQLRAQVNPRMVSLSISASSPSVFVNQPLMISGSLQTHNGTAMAQRNVTITWGVDSISTLTDIEGSYNATIIFRPGYPNGTATIGASFNPVGIDAQQFVTTNATALTQVEYYPTQIFAEASPTMALPLDPVSVTGRLTAAGDTPLANRTVAFLLDDNNLGGVETENDGTFIFNYQVPTSATDGDHTLHVQFMPRAEIFGASAVELPLIVQRDQMVISTTPFLKAILSGFGMKSTGTVFFVQNSNSHQGTLRGNVTIMLDGVPSASSVVSDDGTFSLNLPIPLNVNFGLHSVELVYVPADPRMGTAVKTDQVYVYNTPYVALMASAAVLAPQLILALRRKRRASAVALPQGVTGPSEEPLIVVGEVKVPMSMSDWNSGLKVAQAEKDASRKIVMCYRLVQNLIGSKLNEYLDNTETHWEFYKRVVNLKPRLIPDLRRITELFEIAEYSQFTMRVSEGNEVLGRLLIIRDADLP